MSRRRDTPVPSFVDDEFPARMRELRRDTLWSATKAVALFNRKLEGIDSDERMTNRVLLKWEQGASEPRLGDKIAAVAEVYGVTGGWLLSGKEPRERDAPTTNGSTPAGGEGD